MYDDLIKRLREVEEMLKTAQFREAAILIEQAADVIEELAAFKAQITDGHFYCMRDGILYEAKLNPPKAKSIKLPPIKFAEQPKEKADV